MLANHSIFISYRREDSEDTAGRIDDRLKQHFGAEKVFRDVRSVPYGEDFPDYIDRIVANCQVLLAVIGPGWLAEIKRRLETGEKDWVREELECALDRGITVIPILMSGMDTIPAEDDLPDSLRTLARRNAAPARARGNFNDFEPDMSRLIERIEAITGAGQELLFSKECKDSTLRVPDAISDDEHEQLVNALIAAFPEEEDLALMVKRALKTKLNLITKGNSGYETTVDRVVEWAKSQGKLPELVEGALKRNPGNPQMKALAKLWS